MSQTTRVYRHSMPRYYVYTDSTCDENAYVAGCYGIRVMCVHFIFGICTVCITRVCGTCTVCIHVFLGHVLSAFQANDVMRFIAHVDDIATHVPLMW